MPTIEIPFSGLTNDLKLTDIELIRVIRFMLLKEYEATQLYIQLAKLTDNKFAATVFKDIADEKQIHAGEFLWLLHELSLNKDKLNNNDTNEVEIEIIKD
jgi:rubrerythrin